MKSVKSLRCASACCYFMSAACAVAIPITAYMYGGDLNKMKNGTDNTTDSSEESRAQSASDIRLTMPIASAGSAGLSLLFFIIGGRKRDDATLLEIRMESASREVNASAASLT